ncbi:MAG: queuosine precursor transporter [Candidatus Paceibacterota bacterium]
MKNLIKFKPYPDKISPLYIVLTVLFVTCLMIANIVSGRLVQIGSLTLTSAIFLFPITYIFGDILTEVYGFERSRLVIWLGIIANIIMSLYFWLIIKIPVPVFFENGAAYTTVLGFTPLVVFASILGFFAGEFANSSALSILKKVTHGKWLWTRTIGSTIVGEFVDTAIFITIAFAAVLPIGALIPMLIAQYVFKTLYEIIATPLTYLIVKKVKKVEQLDTFDYGIKYNPFSLKIK